MKYIVRFSGQFKKSFKLCKRRGYDVGKGLSVALRLFKRPAGCLSASLVKGCL